MCGRYAATANPGELVEDFAVETDRTADATRSVLAAPQQPPAGEADYNMAPTKQAPVVLTREHRQLRLLTWGLVPSWSRSPTVGVRMINARSESVLTSRAFGPSARSARALVPAAGWYEWQRSPTATDGRGRPRRQPFYIHRPDRTPLAFAGLYAFWRDREVADGDDPAAWVVSFTILTTAAEPGLDRIHHRQPVVLEPESWQAWLDPSSRQPERVGALLSSGAAGRFAAYPVSTAVNSVTNNGSWLLDPAPAQTLTGVVDPMTGEILGEA